MRQAKAPDTVAAVRRFNRFYTRKIGVLGAGLLGSRFSLTETRVLFEIANHAGPTATEIARDLGLDAGHLSRMLRAFGRDGLVERRRSDTDARRSHLYLTDAGRETFAELDARSSEEVGALLAELSGDHRARLVGAMETIERLTGEGVERAPDVELRRPRAGDLGWVVHRHGVIYSREYGWDARFEGLVAGVAAEFVKNFDPERERAWIAERDGAVIGSIFLVKKTDEVAQLRLLYVEPEARGLGLGRRLVDECTRFARDAGYREIVLWTNSVLKSARQIYEAAGYTLVEEGPHPLFGEEQRAQSWRLEL